MEFEKIKSYLFKIKMIGLTHDLEQMIYVGMIGCSLEEAIEILNMKLEELKE